MTEQQEKETQQSTFPPALRSPDKKYVTAITITPSPSNSHAHYGEQDTTASPQDLSGFGDRFFEWNCRAARPNMSPRHIASLLPATSGDATTPAGDTTNLQPPPMWVF